MVSNYRRGYETERKAFKELTDKGYYCIRSSGSHTLVDLVAFPSNKLKGDLFDEYPILLIQLKRVKGKYYSFKKEMKELSELPVENIVASHTFLRKEFWIWLDKLKGRKAGWVKISC